MFQRVKNLFHRGQVLNWYEKYEHGISYLALVLGFILDNLFLVQIDALADKLVLTMYIALAGLCIILLAVNESKNQNLLKNNRTHFWLSLFLQFCLGGLFSAYVIFYVRGATLESSWPFLALLAAYFLGNEIFKKYYLRLSFSLGVYFFALLFYFIILVPTVVKSVDWWVFVLSTVITVLTFGILIWVISLYKKEHIKINRKARIAYYTSMLLLVNLFYFLNVIPPLPLLLKDSGVYHNLVSIGNGGYTVETESSNGWFGFFDITPTVHRYALEPIYVFTAVYSPIDLNLSVTHNWQKFNLTTNRWVTVSDVKVPIKGGRSDGYRLYSFKRNLTPGLWRVNVVTDNNRLIGRVKFNLVDADFIPETTQLIK